MAQLAGLLYEYDSRGRTKIECKEKARLRGIVSPDRAEALMLALGKPFERGLPDYMLRELAVCEHRKGRGVGAIAEYLDATDDEVQTWLKAASERTYDPFAKTCTGCNGSIPTGTPYTREMDRYYHEDCYR